MLIQITDPDIQKDYPHLAPPKMRVLDMVLTPDGADTIYMRDPGTPEAGNGRLVQCTICSAYLRTGGPHTATLPTPHTAYDMITVIEPELTDLHYTGNLDHTTSKDKINNHNVVPGPIVQGVDGAWREDGIS